MAIWCVCFCGMLWRAIGQLCEIPFGTLYGLFTRWTRLGLWRRLLDQLRRRWRLACGDAPEPSAVVIDSRSCRSAPSCFDRGIDGGKKIRGVKIHGAVDKYGIPQASKADAVALATLAWMKATPVNDFMTKNGLIRADGRLVRDMHMLQIKTPTEPKGEWDLEKVVGMIPGNEAYPAPSADVCPLMKV